MIPGLSPVEDLLERMIAALALERSEGPAAAWSLRVEIDARRPVARGALAVALRWGRALSLIGLAEAEALTLYAALAPLRRHDLPPRYAALTGDPAQRWLTPDLAAALLGLAPDDPTRWQLAPGGTLTASGILREGPERMEPALGPFGTGLLPGPVAGAYLLGAEPARVAAEAGLGWHDAFDERPTVPEAVAIPFATAAKTLCTRPLALIGPPGTGRAALARDAMSRHGLTAAVSLRLDGGPEDVRLATQAVLAARLLGAGLHLDIAALPAEALARMLATARDAHVPLVLTAQTPEAARRALTDIAPLSLPRLTPSDRMTAWGRSLAARGLTVDDDAVSRAAELFDLAEPAITEAVASLAPGLSPVAADTLAAAARNRSRGAFGPWATRMPLGPTLDDLILPDGARARIMALIGAAGARARVFDAWGMGARLGPARGLAAVFTGPSGTGKTLAARVVASALGLDLYRIELASVVSKYIGETEKNLDAAFAAARGANAILLFDEAEALFGKRSEVKDARDRYANIECAYLLQKMEAHDGITLLTTNMAQAFDPAFSRRIQATVDFPRPDAALRERLWRLQFPDSVPRERGIDWASLARGFDLSGGEIRTVALDAALAAASDPRGRITFDGLIAAVERQMVKQGRSPGTMRLRRTPARAGG